MVIPIRILLTERAAAEAAVKARYEVLNKIPEKYGTLVPYSPKVDGVVTETPEGKRWVPFLLKHTYLDDPFTPKTLEQLTEDEKKLTTEWSKKILSFKRKEGGVI